MVSRQERHQADLFFVDLMGALRPRALPDEDESWTGETVGPSDETRPGVSDDELVRRAGRVHRETVQVYPLVKAFLVGRVRMRNRINLQHDHLLKRAFSAYRDSRAEEFVLGVGSSFVYRLAGGEIAPLVREATAAVNRIDWGAYLASPLKPRQSTFRVILVARHDIPFRVWAGVRTAVEAELDAVAAESGRPVVARGFEVVVRNQITVPEVRALDRRDFVVFVFDRVPFVETVRTLVKRHLQPESDKLEQEAVDHVMRQLEEEGGANHAINEREVSFISTVVYKTQYKNRGGDQDAVRGASQRIAELALHEIGHGLRAPHDTGIMNEKAAPSLSDPARHFSTASRRAIRRRLEQLAGP